MIISDNNIEFQAGRRNRTISWMGYAIFIAPIIALVLFVGLYLIPTSERIENTHLQLMDNTARISEIQKYAPADSVSARLARLERQQEILVNDIRQETNNTIDKMNMWLAFWLAIITIFCGLIPVLIQYRLYIVNRENLKQEINYYRDFLRSHAIHNIASNFYIIAKNRNVENSESRNVLLQKFITDSAEIFHELVESTGKSYNNILTPEIISNLIMALLQISMMTDVVKDIVSRAKRREFDAIRDSIRTAVQQLTKLGEPNCRVKADETMQILRGLSYRIHALCGCLP